VLQPISEVIAPELHAPSGGSSSRGVCVCACAARLCALKGLTLHMLMAPYVCVCVCIKGTDVALLMAPYACVCALKGLMLHILWHHMCVCACLCALKGLTLHC